MKNLLSPMAYLLLMSVMLQSCGVIFGGAKYNATIVAKDHPKAQIFVNGNNIGQGTAFGLYDRNDPLVVELRQEGCETKVQTFDKTFRTGNFIASIITWGLVGIVVDLASGAAYKPNHISNPAIEQLSIKDFKFTTDYSGCPTD